MKALEELQKEIEGCCKKAERPFSSVRLVVATKYFNVDQIKTLYNLGLRDFGENRVQEALLKMDALPSDIRWHFFGHLQKNKVNKIKDRFALIHSIDSFEIAKKISEASSQPQSVLIQIKTSDEETKTGFPVEEFEKELSKINSLEQIEVKGLMTIAKRGSEQESLQAFLQLQKLKEQYGQKDWELSMGMSEDLKPAIEAGSTLVRVGRRLL